MRRNKKNCETGKSPKYAFAKALRFAESVAGCLQRNLRWKASGYAALVRCAILREIWIFPTFLFRVLTGLVGLASPTTLCVFCGQAFLGSAPRFLESCHHDSCDEPTAIPVTKPRAG